MGYKGEIKEVLSEGNVPQWFYSPSSARTAQERLNDAINNERSIASFEVYLPDYGPGKRKRYYPPKSIQEKLRTFLEEEHEYHINRLIPPNQGFRHSFYIYVRLGSQGGIKDVELVSHYKN